MAAGGKSTLVVIVGLQLLDSVDNAMFGVFAPEIRESLAPSSSTIAVVAALAAVMLALGALPLRLLGDRKPRTTIAGISTLIWAAAAAWLSGAQAMTHLVAARVLAGIGKANDGPIQMSILTDAYPSSGRGRVLRIHRGAQPFIVIGPLLAAAFAALMPGEAWRWAFLFLALPIVLLGLSALRLREPVSGSLRAGCCQQERIHPTVANPQLLLRVVALGAFGLCSATVPV